MSRSRSEHYNEAERLLQRVAKLRHGAQFAGDSSALREERRELLAEAQVHASLAGAS